MLTSAKEAIVFLKREQFILVSQSQLLCPSPLGCATTHSGLSPQDAKDVLPILQQAKHQLLLTSALHLVYLIVPPVSKLIEPDWQRYELLIDRLYKEHPDAQHVAEYVGIQRSVCCSFMFSKPNQLSTHGRLYRRFYVAVILFAVIQEWPVAQVMQLLHGSGVTRGQLQQLQRDASIFCGMVVVFCQKLNWTLLASCLEDLGSRLGYGVQRDLLPLVRIGSEVSALRARLFYVNDIKCAKDIITVGEEKISELLVKALPYQFRDALQVKSTTSNSSNMRPREYQACVRLAGTIVQR
jgi:hypothetical protein